MAAYGDTNVDGNLASSGETWTRSRLNTSTNATSGYNFYGKLVDGVYVFALQAPVGVTIGAGTTIWINSDLNRSTGFQVFGLQTGADYNINFDAAGVPHFYSGAAGQTLVQQTLDYARSADGRTLEIALPASFMAGAPSTISVYADVNDSAYLSNDYQNIAYTVSAFTTTQVGAVLVDGVLGATEWTSAQRIDTIAPVANWQVYGQLTGGNFVIAVKGPANALIGPGSTIWLNTDRNAATGHQIFGFTGGAEYNVSFNPDGSVNLYSGAEGQTLVAANLVMAYSADRSGYEIAIPANLIGNPSSINVLLDINNSVYLSPDYASAQYTINYTPPSSTTIGPVTFDGALGATEWTSAQRIDAVAPVAGWELYGRVESTHVMFALKGPTGASIGAGTTFWLNTDQNAATGFQVFGNSVGAEYNINIAADGSVNLYSGDAGQTLIASNLTSARSVDGTTIEVAVARASIGNASAVNMVADVNNSVFLPGSYLAAQYSVGTPAPITIGAVTLDGSLADWTQDKRIDGAAPVTGYEVYGQVTGSNYVFAVKAAAGVAIGTNTTLWFNTDRNSATGFQVFGGASGAEYNINIGADGRANLYTGNAGETLVASGLAVRYSADRNIMEVAVAKSAIGNVSSTNIFLDINDTILVPGTYAGAQYLVAEPALPLTIGAVTLDGSLAEWTQAQRIDTVSPVAGNEVYGQVTGNSYVIALKAAPGLQIGANTTVWLNTDRNAATGFQIFGGASGAEYNINIAADGTASLYTGDAGQTLVAADIQIRYSADKSIAELAVSKSLIGNVTSTNVLLDINNTVFLPGNFAGAQYLIAEPLPPVSVGAVTLDGSLSEWTAAQRIDAPGPVAGYEVYGQITGSAFVLAIKAPAGTQIGQNTTIWLNTDQNNATGFQVFGGASGAEYNVNFNADGSVNLYTGNAGQTLVAANLVARFSADRSTVEVAIPQALVGNAASTTTFIDVNDTVFLPGNFAGQQYLITTPAIAPPRTDFTKKVAIVYSETSAANYFNLTNYGQLFMTAQSQAQMAGIPFDILTEADLKDLSKLVNYDAIVFPNFTNVRQADLPLIEKNLLALAQQTNVSLIAAGNFMTLNETGAVLSGDPYARMKALFDLAPDGAAFPATVTLTSAGTGFGGVGGYTAGETIRSYTNVGALKFTDATPSTSALTVISNQTVNGVTSQAVVVSEATGDRNVHFSTESVLADNNQLWQAIQYAVNGATGPSVGLQLTRQANIVTSRNDMDLSQYVFSVDPEDGSPGVYDKLIPILDSWRAQYNFVGSFYINLGNNPNAADGPETTNWALSRPYYAKLLASGDEIGAHSYTHPEDTNALTAAQIDFEFNQEKQIIQQQLGITVVGAALPGAPETLATARQIIQYFDYITGGFSGVGAGYPGAFGYLTPDLTSKVYLAPNITFDNNQISVLGRTPAQADAAWAAEWAARISHAETPIIMLPWHDYGPTSFDEDPDYVLSFYQNFIARAYASGSEFITVADLAKRIVSQEKAQISSTVAGSVITATVVSNDAGKFALDVDNLGTQVIKNVGNWYAYDNDSVFTARNGGTYAITLGASADDNTHIIKLPARGELVSVTGDGKNLSFTVVGEGEVVVDLRNTTETLTVTGATVVNRVGEIATLRLGTNLVVNGSFESFAIADATIVNVANGQLQGWTNSGSTAIELWRNWGGVQATRGTNFIELDYASGVDNIRQTITTQAGAAYQLSVDMRARPAVAAASNTVEVWFGGALVATVDPGTNWSTYTWTVYASAASAALELREVAADNDGVGALIDNVNLFALAPATHNVTLTLAVPNVAPVITSNGGGATAAISLAENLTAVTTVVATDATAVTYGIAGGADASKFTINAATGALAFIIAPDYEAPTDVGANRVYDVIVSATDTGGLSDTQAIAVTITNVNGVTLNGTSGADTLNGTLEPDTINGAAGNDTISGGGGNDRITGGTGRDVLTGGAGADVFVYTGTGDSPVGAAGRDLIMDFVRGEDKIDLSAIDANTGLLALLDQAFTWQGLVTTVSGGVGQLSTQRLGYHYETINGVVHTIIEGNVNSGAAADFQIALYGQYALTASDFIL